MVPLIRLKKGPTATHNILVVYTSGRSYWACLGQDPVAQGYKIVYGGWPIRWLKVDWAHARRECKPKMGYTHYGYRSGSKVKGGSAGWKIIVPSPTVPSVATTIGVRAAPPHICNDSWVIKWGRRGDDP